MLSRLQKKYADLPVRFLLFPCNQFGAQEPKKNSEIKDFAEQYVTLAKNGQGSNVIMFAKSNLNGVPCTYSGKDACMPESAECCSQNDAVYQYLLAKTAPGKIAWNFDKIVTDVMGKPFPGETILHGGDTDAVVQEVVEKLLVPSSTASWATVGAGWSLAMAAAIAAALVTMLGFYRTRSMPMLEPDDLEEDRYIQIS
eukprot:s3347_g19.t1